MREGRISQVNRELYRGSMYGHRGMVILRETELRRCTPYIMILFSPHVI